MREGRTDRFKNKAKRLSGKKADFLFRKKVCKFCMDKVNYIDYKDALRLRKFITEKGKILSSRMTGVCSRHQRGLALAIKRARFVAFLPYVAE